VHSSLITIEQHILEQQKAHPEATGILTGILYDIALAAKIIAREIRSAGLRHILGEAGSINVQGERQMKLDIFANEVLVRMSSFAGRVAAIGSEEMAAPIFEMGPMRHGKYVLIFDPLDGSSNIDVNISVGTIFGIYRRKSDDGREATMEDVLQPGKVLVAAGYVIYGSSTMMVYSTGSGVHGFTLEPALGEFLLSHPDIRIPERPQYYSTNMAYERWWSEGVRRYTAYLQGMEAEKPPAALSSRYVGSLVADFHRNLLRGGVFYYPLLYKPGKAPKPKLRLLCEAAPMAFIAVQAGGYASDGTQDILEIVPKTLHQRVPFFVGNRSLVERAEDYIRRYG